MAKEPQTAKSEIQNVDSQIQNTREKIKQLKTDKIAKKYNDTYLVIANTYSTASSDTEYEQNAIYHTNYHFYLNPYHLARMLQNHEKRVLRMNDNSNSPLTSDGKRVEPCTIVSMKQLQLAPFSFKDIIFNKKDLNTFTTQVALKLAKSTDQQSVLRNIIRNGAVLVRKKWPIDIIAKISDEDDRKKYNLW